MIKGSFVTNHFKNENKIVILIIISIYVLFARNLLIHKYIFLNTGSWEFPGATVIRTPHSHCWGPRFNPWLGNWDPTSHGAQPKKRKSGSWFTIFNNFMVWLSLGVKQITSMINYYSSQRNYNILNYLFHYLMILISYLVILMTF